MPQIACFDTAFHRTLPQVEQMLPLPHALWDRGVRRYGFHGLSYEYMAIALAERHGDARARAHDRRAPGQRREPVRDARAARASPRPWASPRSTA